MPGKTGTIVPATETSGGKVGHALLQRQPPRGHQSRTPGSEASHQVQGTLALAAAGGFVHALAGMQLASRCSSPKRQRESSGLSSRPRTRLRLALVVLGNYDSRSALR